MVGDAIFNAVFSRKRVIVFRRFLLRYRKSFDVAIFPERIEYQCRIESSGEKYSDGFFVPYFTKNPEESFTILTFEVPIFFRFSKTEREGRYRIVNDRVSSSDFEFPERSEFKIPYRIEKREVRGRSFEYEGFVYCLTVGEDIGTDAPEDRLHRSHIGSDNEVSPMRSVIHGVNSQSVADYFNGIDHFVEADCRKAVRRFFGWIVRKPFRHGLFSSEEKGTVLEFRDSLEKKCHAAAGAEFQPIFTGFRKRFDCFLPVRGGM